MNPQTRNILIGGTVLVVAALITCFVQWVMPLQAQIGSLRLQLASASSDNQQQSATLKAIEASNSIIVARMSKLAPYDLRNEEKPASVEQVRANNLLTQLMDVFQAATLSVEALDPVASQDLPIQPAVGSSPIAIVSKRSYRLLAMGMYRDWIAALAQLRTLPPTITLSHYKMEYLSKVGSQASVGVTMDLSFNFLTKAKEAPDAGSGALQTMKQNLGGKQSALFDRAVAMLGQWFCPPAEARSTPGRGDRHGRRSLHGRQRSNHRHHGSRWRQSRRTARRHAAQLARTHRRAVQLATGRLEVGPREIRVVGDRQLRFHVFTLKGGRIEVVDLPGLYLPRRAVAIRRDGVRAVETGQFLPATARLVLLTDGRKTAVRRGSLGSVVVALSSEPRAPERVFRRVVVRPPLEDVIRRVVPWREAARTAGRLDLDTHIRRVRVWPQDRGITVHPELAPITAAPNDVFRLLLAPSPVPSKAPPAAGPAAGSSVSAPAAAFGGLATMPVAHDTFPVGRAEPFWPIIDATDDASIQLWEAKQRAKPAATAHDLVRGLALPIPPILPGSPPHHDIQVLGILQIGNKSVAMLRVDGQPSRVTAGSDIATDYHVQSISTDFVSIRTPDGTRRYDLTRTWQAPVATKSATAKAAPTAASYLPTVGGAGVPALPALPPGL